MCVPEVLSTISLKVAWAYAIGRICDLPTIQPDFRVTYR